MKDHAATKHQRRIVLRTSEVFGWWAQEYASWLQISLSDLVAQALLRHADGSGFSGSFPAPQRVERRTHNPVRDVRRRREAQQNREGQCGSTPTTGN